MADALHEILETWLIGVRANLGVMAAMAAAAVALAVLANFAPSRLRPFARPIEMLVLIGVMMFGTYRAAQEAWVADDAFITFRYARNFAEGNGLVWNLGEHVEGYTNFLWTVVIGVLIRLGVGEAPAIGLFGSLAAFAVCLVVVHRTARLLAADAPFAWLFPIASLWLALQYTFVSFGTSGLETSTAALFVVTGAFFVSRLRGLADAALAGLCFALATLTRPDHLLFYGAGGVALLASVALPIVRARTAGPAGLFRAGLDRAVAFSAPSLLIAAHLAFRLSYYGEWVPNTYYAKSADLTYYDQGLVYTASFYLGSHLLFLAPIVLAWACVPTRAAANQRFKVLLLVSFVLYTFYVIRVGGDFMFGRFFVSLLPLFALGAGQLVVELMAWARGPLRLVAYGWVAVLAASTLAVRMIPDAALRWQIADEATYYRVTQWSPVVVNHSNFRTGQLLGKLYDSGIKPVLATSGVGMLGYYSKMEVIDLVGLVDAYVARQPLKRRRRPGHEKQAPPEYLAQRGVHFVRDGYVPPEFGWISLIGLTPPARWHILKYDRELMARIRAQHPSVPFTDVTELLDRPYPKDCDGKRDPAQIEEELRFFKRYYFSHNQDPERYVRFKQKLRACAALARNFAQVPQKSPVHVAQP